MMLARLWRKAIWALYLRLFTVHEYYGIRFLNIRLGEAEEEEYLRSVVRQAAIHIARADPIIRDLVAREIRFVAATRHRRSSIVEDVGAFVLPFDGEERRHPELLATHIAWAAAALPLRRHAALRRDGPDVPRGRMAATCGLAQRIVAESFLHPSRWRRYLEQLHDEYLQPVPSSSSSATRVSGDGAAGSR